MDKEDWVLLICVLLLVLVFDQVSKQYVLTLSGPVRLGAVSIEFYPNSAFIGGLFNNLPATLRVVATTTLGALLVFIYFVIQYLVAIRSMTFRVAITILTAGYLGNVLDKVFYGYVVDFIKFYTKPGSFVVFNIADVFQWIGAALTMFCLFRFSALLWPEDNRRGQIWINPRFQGRVIFIFLTSIISFALMVGFYSYTFIKISLVEYGNLNEDFVSQFLSSFVVSFLFVLVSFVIFVLLFARIWSHRLAGPVYAIQRYVLDRMSGVERGFRLRTGDEFKELEGFAKEFEEKLSKVTEAKKT